MPHWKTTFCGAVQSVGWALLGIALYSDLSGQPKSQRLATIGLAGCLIIGVFVFLHGWHSSDKPKPEP